MKLILNKIASVLALVIGVMAIVAGGRVLLGNDPGYMVINWLVLYNYTIGILTVFLSAPLIWANSRFGLPAAIATLCLNALVMIILLVFYGDTVAPDSIVAMTIRIFAWIIILGLMMAQSRWRREGAAGDDV